MNIRHTNNKTLKIVAIAAGSTAAALLLAAGLVAGGGSDDKQPANTPAAVITVPSTANQDAPVAAGIPGVSTVAGAVGSSDSVAQAASVAKKSPAVTRQKKSKQTTNVGEPAAEAPASAASEAVVETLSPVTPSASGGESTTANTPTEQPTQIAEAPAAQQDTASGSSTSGSSTQTNVPQWTLETTSRFTNPDLTTTQISLPRCLPGLTC